MATKKTETNCNVFVGDQVVVRSDKGPLKFQRWVVTKVGLKDNTGQPLDFQARHLKTGRRRQFSPFEAWVEILVPDSEIDPGLLRHMRDNPHLRLIRRTGNLSYRSHRLFDLSTWYIVWVERKEISRVAFKFEKSKVIATKGIPTELHSEYSCTMTAGLRAWLREASR